MGTVGYTICHRYKIVLSKDGCTIYILSRRESTGLTCEVQPIGDGRVLHVQRRISLRVAASAFPK